MGRPRSQSCLNIFRSRKLRYHPISEFSVSQNQPLLNKHNQFMEAELEHDDDVQALWKKCSVLEKEIEAFKSYLSMLETKLQDKAEEGNNQQKAMSSLEQRVHMFEKNLDRIVLEHEAQKDMNSNEITNQGRSILKIEKKNSNLEKKIAELETRIDEMTYSTVDAMAITSSSNPQVNPNNKKSGTEYKTPIMSSLEIFREALAKVLDMAKSDLGLAFVKICFLVIIAAFILLQKEEPFLISRFT